jgi:hypothetical protein
MDNIQNISQKDTSQHDEPQQLRTFEIKSKNITPIQLHLLPSKNLGCPPIIQNKLSCGARLLFTIGKEDLEMFLQIIRTLCR